jgi:hypothetical protein
LKISLFVLSFYLPPFQIHYITHLLGFFQLSAKILNKKYFKFKFKRKTPPD